MSRSVLSLAIASCLVAAARAQAFPAPASEVIVGTLPATFGPAVFDVFTTPGTQSLLQPASFSSFFVPGPPGPAATGGAAWDSDTFTFVVVNGAAFGRVPHPLYQTFAVPPAPLPPAVMTALQSPAVGVATNFGPGHDLLFVSATARIVQFDGDTFTVVNTIQLPPAVGTVVDIDHRPGRLIAVNAVGQVHQIDPATGAILSTSTPPSPLPSPAVDAAICPAGSVLILMDNGVVVDQANPSVPLVTGATGKVLATHPAPVVKTAGCGLSGDWGINGPTIGGNSAFALTISNSIPNTFGVVALSDGFDPTGVPLDGGCLVHLTGNVVVVGLFATTALGHATINAALPWTNGATAELNVQAAVLNPGPAGPFDFLDAVGIQAFPF